MAFAALREPGPRNSAPLQRRDELQSKIDAWHRGHPGPFRSRAVQGASGLRSAICCPSAPPAIDTAGVDAEVAQIAGPQLVVPVSNARYAQRGQHARCSFIRRAFYGTDAIAQEGAIRGGSSTIRGAAPRSSPSRDFLDANFPLADGSHRDAGQGIAPVRRGSPFN